MRGRPLRQWIVFIIAWCALAYPIYRVIHGAPPDDTRSAPPGGADTIRTWVSLRFSDPPDGFELSQDSMPVWREPSPDGLRFERALPLQVDTFGIALLLHADLPEGSAAIEVRLEPDGRDARSQTVWADGMLERQLEFSWEVPSATR